MKRGKGGTMRLILIALKQYSPALFATVALAVLQVAGALSVPYLAGQAIDCILGKGNVDFSSLKRIFLAMGGWIALSAAAQWLMSLCNDNIAYHVLKDVRCGAFRKIGVLPLRYLDARAYGETASVVISDAEQFSDGLLLGFTQLFTGFATIFGVLIILFFLRWEIALVVLCLTPLSFFAAKFISFRTYRMFREQALIRAEQTAFLDETIGSLKVVKAFSHEEENQTRFEEINKRFEKCSLKALFFSSTTNPTTRFINSIVYALVALTGALLVISTAGSALPFTVGGLSACLAYATQVTKPFNEITEVVAEFQNALACAARIFALREEEEETDDSKNEALGSARGEVSLKNVVFSYDGKNPIIRGLSAEIPAGKRVAIVGETGCGKTTLINLLMRFYDADEGSVEVDGKDVRTLTRKSLRENFGMVLQETWLKSATVRENLCMGRPDASEEEMIAAAKAAHAHSFIMRLPEGYETVVESEGILSQGQKQLLCIARVMLLRPPMLILDEATSNIDTRTERKVQDALEKLMKGRTCFIVAHRLSTIESADIILVMREGKIVERGTHEELLALGGEYYALYSAQFAS